MASQELPPLPSLPPTREANLEEWQPTRQIQSPFFRLPPELRQMILHAAFGDRTIHMDLRFRPPLFAPQTGDKGGPDPVHGGFPPLVDSHEGAIPSLVWHPRADAVMAWRWYSCLCHRNPPEARGTPLWQQPCLDRCLYGQGSCSSFPGEFPAKCMVGVMGFLLSCKRAHDEVVPILYATNTIFIESDPLINGLLRQGLVPGAARLTGPGMQMITALHVRWDFRLWHGTCREYQAEQRLLFSENLKLMPRAFPRLRQLELIFPPDMYTPSIPKPEDNMAELETVLMRPLMTASAEIADLQELNVAVPHSVFLAFAGLVRDKDEEIKAMLLANGVFGIKLWYPLTGPLEDRGRPGKGFFLRQAWPGCPVVAKMEARYHALQVTR